MTSERTISRRERDQKRRRKEILEAAKGVFVAHGFEGATMQEIATKAEFPLASVYKIFESKENLFQALMVDFVQRYLTRLDEAVSAVENPLEKIKTSIRVSIRNFEKEKALGHLLLRNLRGLWSPDNEIQPANLAYRAFFSYYEDLFKQARERGETCDVDPSEATLCLVGTLYIKLVYTVFVNPLTPLDAETILRVVLGPIENTSAMP